MKTKTSTVHRNLVSTLLLATLLTRPAPAEEVGRSPWGPDDQIGTLNLMTDASRLKILSRIDSGRTYDLSVEYFVGMPSFHHLGDPGYQYWLTHTPRGTVIDDPNHLGEAMNSKVSYTGQAQHYHDAAKYLHDYPGVSLEAVRWLIDQKEIMLLGSDNLSLEAFPSERSDNWVPVHTYLLAERGVMFLEQLQLEELSKDQVYEFAFIAASLKLRGASGAPLRPIALPVRK